MTINPLQEMRDGLTPIDELPDDVDIGELMCTFAIDGQTIRAANGEEGSAFAWIDMRTVPAVGDYVMRRAINVDEDGAARVIGRGWMAHNWVVLYVERVEVGPC